MNGNTSQTFVFQIVPNSVEQLSMLPESDLNSPFKSASLAMLVLLEYENNPENCFKMMDFLRGPDPLSAYAKSFIKDRLKDKGYKVKSFFNGSSVENNYTPTMPYTITVSSTPYSFPDSNWATLYVKSSGADSSRPIKLRHKPSTNQWFVNDIQALSDIRTPICDDPWA